MPLPNRPQPANATAPDLNPFEFLTINEKNLQELVHATTKRVGEAWWRTLAARAADAQITEAPEVIDMNGLDYKKKIFRASRFRNIPSSLAESWPHQLDFTTLRIVAVAYKREHNLAQSKRRTIGWTINSIRNQLNCHDTTVICCEVRRNDRSRFDLLVRTPADLSTAEGVIWVRRSAVLVDTWNISGTPPIEGRG